METKVITLWDKDYPTTLSGQDWKAPLNVFDEFFRNYSLDGAHLLPWQSLPLIFTNQFNLSPDLRCQLLRMVNHLERLVDAAWVLTNYSSVLPGYIPGTRLKALIQSDRLSFLSLRESLKPVSTIRQIFPDSLPNCWKPLLLKDIRWEIQMTYGSLQTT